MRYHVADPSHQGVIAAPFEHPDRWQARSHVVGNYQHTSGQRQGSSRSQSAL